MTDSAWQEDWNSFADLLEDHLKADRSEADLSAFFGGSTVKWCGELEQKSLDDDLAPSVGILLPEKLIAFGEGYSTVIDGISLPVADNEVESWRHVDVGEPVRFTARIHGKGSLFPAVQVQTFSSGKAIVLIGLSEGVLVG